jgi:hypothetical protein
VFHNTIGSIILIWFDLVPLRIFLEHSIRYKKMQMQVAAWKLSLPLVRLIPQPKMRNMQERFLLLHLGRTTVATKLGQNCRSNGES